MARTLELIDDMEFIENGDYDIVVFDVLGDVVCGGFAAPLREAFADKVVFVLSEEPMAVYAANNIGKAVQVYERNGAVLAGLIGNLKDSSQCNKDAIERFAARIKTKVLGYIPRDPMLQDAERQCKTVVEFAPDSPAAVAFREVTQKIMDVDKKECVVPEPMTNEEFYEWIKTW